MFDTESHEMPCGLYWTFLFSLSRFPRISKKRSTNDATNNIQHMSVNACLMPVLAADGCHITTVEGIGSVKNNNLHPVQKAMTELHGSQCGTWTSPIFRTTVCQENVLFYKGRGMDHMTRNEKKKTSYFPIHMLLLLNL